MLRIISDENRMNNEEDIIKYLLKNGLDYYHFRKPNWSLERKENFLNGISLRYRNRIVAHYNSSVLGVLIHHKSGKIERNVEKKHSCSNHTLEEVEENLRNYENLFWSPVYDSISKSGYKGNSKICLGSFSEEDKKRIIALGGVEPSKFKDLKEKGFQQIAIKGWFWNQPDYKNAWQEIKNTWQKIERKY